MTKIMFQVEVKLKRIPEQINVFQWLNIMLYL